MAKQESGVILEQGDLGMFYGFNEQDKKTYDNKIKSDSEKEKSKKIVTNNSNKK